MNEEERLPPPKPGLVERLKASPITFAILAINVAWFLWAEHHGSTETNAVLLRFGAVEPIHVWSGEYWRVASYMFLHIGWVHLLWNSYAGFSICAGVERALGQRRFLLAYLLSGIAGGAATTVTFYPGPSAGASGAMFGMIGALIALRHRQLGNFNALLADRPTRATLINAGIWLVIGTQLNFNNRAHIGGLVAGAIVTFALTSPDRLMPIVAAGFGAVLLVSFRPWWQPQGVELEKLEAYGTTYLVGANGFAKNVRRGERFSRRACDAGGEMACQVLAFTALTEGSDAEKQQAAELLRKSCSEGKALACDILARHAEQAGDRATAAELYAKACDGGGPKNACTRLAFLKLYEKRGTPPDYAEIAKLFDTACLGGDNYGCAGQGAMLRYGLGVEKDEARGEKVLRDTCNGGDTWSCAVLDAGTQVDVSNPPEE